jgi:hypothetical protein
MVKKKATKNENELVKKDGAEDSEVLATTFRDGKKVTIEKWHIAGIDIPPICIVGSDSLDKDRKDALSRKFSAVKEALRSDSKSLQDQAIDAMIGDLVIGAYQDKLIVYQAGHDTNSLEALREMQKVRQAADNHLLRIIKAVKDIKQSKTTFTVKEAQQVNVADKQINVSQKSNS